MFKWASSRRESYTKSLFPSKNDLNRSRPLLPCQPTFFIHKLRYFSASFFSEKFGSIHNGDAQVIASELTPILAMDQSGPVRYRNYSKSCRRRRSTGTFPSCRMEFPRMRLKENGIRWVL
jgi:hypothetical protein